MNIPPKIPRGDQWEVKNVEKCGEGIGDNGREQKKGRYKLGSGQNTKVSMGDRWRVRVIWKMRQRNEEWREMKREKKRQG